MRFTRKIKFLALLSAVAVSAGLVVAGSAAHAGGGYTFLDVESTLSPDTVPTGGSVLWQITVSNFSETINVSKVTASFSVSDGAFDLSATNNVNGSSLCKKENPPPDDFAAAAATQNVSCKVGDLAAGDSKTLGVVVNTTGVAAGTTIFGDVFVRDQTGESTGSDFVQIHVIAADPNSKTTYVPPGGTVTVGPKNPDADNPTVGGFTLPKKIIPGSSGFAAASTPKPVPGPGAVITITITDPAAEPTACGGQQCQGKIINVSDFSGYTDKKHPAFFKLRWAGNVLPANSVLYIIKPDAPNGIAIPPCIKVKGVYTNTPCIARHAENKKTHKITDTVAILSGDPGGARRG
jgi:hypothetical protein